MIVSNVPVKVGMMASVVTASTTVPEVGDNVNVGVGGFANVKRSEDDVADVPLGVVTVTSTAPVPDGLVAVIVVAFTTTRLVPDANPNLTAVAPVNPVPEIVTGVPPASGPLAGLMPVTVGGAGAVKVNWSADKVVDVPPGVVTVMSIVPVPAGLLAVIVVELTTVSPVPGVAPKFTTVAPVNPVPVTVTGVPPEDGPLVGLTPLTVGTATYVKWSADDVAEVPTGVVTVTSTVPVPEWLVTVIVLSLTTTTLVPAFAPKLTAVAPVKPEPMTVTDVPPANGPDTGLTLATTGGGVGGGVPAPINCLSPNMAGDALVW